MKHSSVTNLQNFATLNVTWWPAILHNDPGFYTSAKCRMLVKAHVQFLIRLWFWCNLDVLSCTKYNKCANSQSAFLGLFCQNSCLSSQVQVLEQFKPVGAHLEEKKKKKTVLLNATQSRRVLPLVCVICFTSHWKAMVCSITCLHSDCAVQVLIANLFLQFITVLETNMAAQSLGHQLVS